MSSGQQPPCHPRRPRRGAAGAVLLALCGLVSAAASQEARPSPGGLLAPVWLLAPRQAIAQGGGPMPLRRRVYLPFLDRAQPPQLRYPEPALAEAVWEAAAALDARYLGPQVFPGDLTGGRPPGPTDLRLNLQSACHDFPDQPGGLFGVGAHRAACDSWVAAWRGLWHAGRAWRAAFPADGRPAGLQAADPRDIAWAGLYLDALIEAVAPFVYGPEDRAGPSYRDSLAALWQNPARAIDLVLLAELLRQLDALRPEQADQVAELSAAISRAWFVSYRVGEGALPNTDEPFTSAAYPAVRALSPAGLQVAPAFSWTFRWQADKGNTQAEENGWQGAGVLLTSKALGRRLEDAPLLASGARRFLDYSIVFDRPDPVSGRRIRSLNAESSGGPYGQRPYWLENHTADVPSLPYLGFTWQTLGLALMSRAPEEGPWESLVQDAGDWETLRRSLIDTVRAPDGGLLIDFSPGGGIGYAMDAYPLWTMPCAAWQEGRHYVRYDGRAGVGPAYLSEIGQPAGIDVLNLAPPLLRLAAWKGDADAYLVWRARLAATLAEYGQRPPNPAWARCNVAPYVSSNPGYHGARLQSSFLVAYLALRGFAVGEW